MWALRLLERLAGPRSLQTSPALPVPAAALALCLTVLYLAMRRVMEVGGTCASGGPYEIATPCPKGVGWMLPLGIIGGMAAAAALALLAGKGPKLWALAWPVLFLSLGWNFLDFGLHPPGPAREGLDWGFLTCGITFVLMGGVPLLGLLRWGARRVFLGDPVEGEAPGRAAVVACAYAAIPVGIWLGALVVDAGAG